MYLSIKSLSKKESFFSSSLLNSITEFSNNLIINSSLKLKSRFSIKNRCPSSI